MEALGKRTVRSACALLLAALVAAAACCALAPAAWAYTAHTQDEAIAWAKSKVGTPVGRDDGSGYYQCVEFIQAYYQYLGVSSVSGNGCDYAWNSLPAGWTRTAGGQPQKGDILVYGAYGTQAYGHVAIYESDNSLYDQDGSVWGATVKHESANYRTYTWAYWGCIHPDFKAAPQGTSVRFSPWSNDNYTYITETDASIGQQIDVTGGSATDSGMVLYDRNRNELASKANGSFYYRVYFKVNAELGYRLTPGVTYQYRFWADVDGKRYWSDYQSFTTAGPTSFSVSFGQWENGNYTYIRDTDASIGQQIDVTGGNPTDAGIVLFNHDRSKELGRKTEGTFYYRMYYKVNEELGVTLTPGTTYQYRFFAVVDGSTYWSDYQSFRTTGGHTHSWDTTVMPASWGEAGSVTSVCAICGETGEKSVIAAIASIEPSAASFTYNGKVQRPAIMVRDSSGAVVSDGYYIVDYAVPDSTDPGIYGATVNFTGNYKGARTVTYSIEAAAGPEPVTPTDPDPVTPVDPDPAPAYAADLFSDVERGYWVSAEGWLDYVVSQGLMEGYANGRFNPSGALTRGQVATILYRHANPQSRATKDAAAYEANATTFSDNEDYQYYTAAVNWAAASGVMDDSNARCRPSDKVTRQELASMLYRYVRLRGGDVSGASAASYAGVPGAADVASWHEAGMGWAYAHGVVAGSGDTGSLNPASTATRAQMAKMITVVCRDVLG